MSKLPVPRKEPAKRQKQQNFNLVSLTNQAYNLYIQRNVFIAIPLVMFVYHTFAYNVFMVANFCWQLPATGAVFYGAHHTFGRFLRTRKKLLVKIGVVAFLIWLKFGLASFLAVDFVATVISLATFWGLHQLWKWYVNSQRMPGDVYIDGSRKIEPQLVFKQVQQQSEVLVAQGAPNEYVQFAGFPLHSKVATTGFLFFGEARSGKSVLISCILKSLRYQDKNAIIFDASGNTYAKLLALGVGHRVINMNPFHADCYAWDLSQTFSNDAATRVFFTNVMKSAKGEAGKNGGNASSSFFEKDAANMATLVIKTLRRSARLRGLKPNFGLKELCYICTNKKRLLTTLKKFDDIWEAVEEFADGGDQNSAVYGTLKQVFEGLKPMAECYDRARQLGRTYDFKNFANSNDIILLGRNEEYGGSYLEHWNGAIVQYVISTILGTSTTDETKPVKTFFILDEFTKLGRVDKLINVSTEGGKYAMCLVAATQSISGIRAVYGDDKTNDLTSSITHTAFLTLGDSKTDEFASKYFGQTIVKEPSVTLSPDTAAKSWVKPLRRSVTWAKKAKPLFERGHFTSQRKISTHGVMGITADCDKRYLHLELTKEDIGLMMPPAPTPEMLRENEKPQDEDTLRFKPLDDSELIMLCMPELMKSAKQEAVQDEPVVTSTSFEEIDFSDVN